MATDYNIYIHAMWDSDGSSDTRKGKDKTKVKNDRKGKKTAKKDYWTTPLDTVKKDINKGISNFKDQIGEGLGKGAVAVAVAYEVAKFTDKVLSFTLPYVANETGDFTGTIAYNNFKQVLGYVFNPVSFLKTSIQIDQQTRLNNQRLSEERKLTGNSIINTYGNGRSI